MNLVDLVCLVYLVCLVGDECMNKRLVMLMGW